MDDLKALAMFWEGIYKQDSELFSLDALKLLFVLSSSPNSMWENITSVYFLHHRDKENKLDMVKFVDYLRKITAFTFAYSIVHPGVNLLRAPIYDEMVNMVEGQEVTFARYKMRDSTFTTSFQNNRFSNQRSITRSMITWYAFSFPEQVLLNTQESFHLEHIFAKKRQEVEKVLTDSDNLEALGNKVLLEGSINIRASDYRFEDKKKIYSAEMRRGKNKEPTEIFEISNHIITFDHFGEEQIRARDKKIMETFIGLLKAEGLIEQPSQSSL